MPPEYGAPDTDDRESCSRAATLGSGRVAKASRSTPNAAPSPGGVVLECMIMIALMVCAGIVLVPLEELIESRSRIDDPAAQLVVSWSDASGTPIV